MKLLLFVEQAYSFDILGPVARQARAEGEDVAWFVLPGVAAQGIGAEPVLRTVREARAFGADAVLVPGNWVPLGLGRLAVQVFHGLALEKKGHFRVRGFFDLYCTPGPFVTGLYRAEAERHGYFGVVETGWPKLDPYAAAAVEERGPRDPLHVLYAPTFSRALTSLPDLLEEWARLSRDKRFVLRVKMHPLTDPELCLAYERALPEGVVVPASANVLEQIAGADVVVSDTSSTIREANWLGRPCVTYRTARPGRNVIDFHSPDALDAVLMQAVAGYGALRQAGRDSLSEIHPYCDGQSSGRVLAAVRGRLAGPQAIRRKPLNLLRRAKVWWRIKKAEQKAVQS